MQELIRRLNIEHIILSQKNSSHTTIYGEAAKALELLKKDYDDLCSLCFCDEKIDN